MLIDTSLTSYLLTLNMSIREMLPLCSLPMFQRRMLLHSQRLRIRKLLYLQREIFLLGKVGAKIPCFGMNVQSCIYPST